ncbi:MAG: hypothetical protein ACLTXP_11005 [Odoribacter splanchnicus]
MRTTSMRRNYTTPNETHDTNHKLSMALEVASIVPWNWITQTYFCDVNRPVELSNVGQQVDEEKLSVPDTQYFPKYIRRIGNGSNRLITI